ncbi:MAG: type I-E CRISPR-associated protein Cse2/CasB [Verrucomicrobia bacterium]|nr:type I-E CRISPR-associated protein Cse2/CasB [Verrucomicrobiota bacterium]
MKGPYQFPGPVLRFLANLRRLESRGDRGALAALRRGESETFRHFAWPIIRQCGGSLVEDAAAWTSIGAAFAFYPQPKGQAGDGSNFGATCNALAGRPAKDGNRSFDPYFRRVLGAESSQELARWVVRIAKRARTAKPWPAPINYEELLTALIYWDTRDGAFRERYRRRWATAYWGSVSEDKELHAP